MARLIPDSWQLPPALRERVGTRPGRQRALFHDGHALLLLHKVPEAHARDRQAVVFWRSPQREWRAAPGRDGFATLRDHVESFHDAVEALDDRIEAARGANDFFEALRTARPLLRATRNLHAVLSQLKDSCAEDGEILALRDRAYETERLADLAVGEAEAGMQFTMALRGEEQARLSERIAKESHRLNLIAALFMPITALGAVLGMNLENGLEALPEPLTFWLFVAGAFGAGLAVQRVVRIKQG